MKAKWFRRMLAGAVTAAMCCSMLSGCGKGVEQTNEELNVYVTADSYSSLIQYPLTIYQKQYPDVKVNVHYINDEDIETYYDSLSGSLMTGKNIPDVLVADLTFCSYCDLYKMEQSGAFVDLEPLLAADTDYDASRYQSGVVDGLKYGECQYWYPLSYDLPYIMSTEETLEKLGITAEEFHSLDLLEFYQLVNQIHEEQGLSIDEILSGRVLAYLDNYANWYLPDTINFEQREFSLDKEKVQQLIESLAFVRGKSDEASSMDGLFYSAHFGNFFRLQAYAQHADDRGETPVLTCLTDVNGNINARVRQAVAIPQLSPNQQNAYNFLKVLLSDAIQDLDLNDMRGNQFSALSTPILISSTTHWRNPYGTTAFIKTMREQDKQYCSQISSSFLPSVWSKMVMDEAQAYYNGNGSAADAVETVENKLKIYVSE